MWLSMPRKEPTRTGRRPRRKLASRVQEEFGPPVARAELHANLSDLQRELNERMMCHAGKNQVVIRSLLTGTGTTRPRIMLRCSLRADVGLKPEVFYEYIRDVCCSDPEQCEAYRNLKERFVDT